jgi:hypothetical protein
MADKEIINLQNDEWEILPIEVLNSECKCIRVSVQKFNNNICEFRN